MSVRQKVVVGQANLTVDLTASNTFPSKAIAVAKSFLLPASSAVSLSLRPATFCLPEQKLLSHRQKLFVRCRPTSFESSLKNFLQAWLDQASCPRKERSSCVGGQRVQLPLDPPYYIFLVDMSGTISRTKSGRRDRARQSQVLFLLFSDPSETAIFNQLYI